MSMLLLLYYGRQNLLYGSYLIGVLFFWRNAPSGFFMGEAIYYKLRIFCKKISIFIKVLLF